MQNRPADGTHTQPLALHNAKRRLPQLEGYDRVANSSLGGELNNEEAFQLSKRRRLRSKTAVHRQSCCGIIVH